MQICYYRSSLVASRRLEVEPGDWRNAFRRTTSKPEVMLRRRAWKIRKEYGEVAAKQGEKKQS